MSEKLVSVIIPNWNGKKYLQTCLTSLFRQNYKDFEIIIVDNGSTDSSLSFIRINYPECRLITFPENRGFSVAVNAGIEAANGDYIVLLNNDTEVDKNWLSELCNALDCNSEVGFCASKMLAYNDRQFIDGVGDAYVRGGMAYKLGWAETDNGQYDKPAFVFGACAGAAIYRKDMFAQIGIFDEDFFAYLEDVDISFRAQLSGFKCLYVPTAIVFHMGSATTGSRFNKTTVYLSAKNYINVLVKDLPGQLFLRDFYWISRTITVTFLKYIIRGRGPSLALYYIKGLFSGLGQYKIMKQKRNIIQANIKVPIEYIRAIMLQSEISVKKSKQNRRIN